MGWITIGDPKLQTLLDEDKTSEELELEYKQGRPNPPKDAEWDAVEGEKNK